MFYDIKIEDDLFDVPLNPPSITRQYGCLNLLELSNSILFLNTEVNFDEYIFKSIPDLSNSSKNHLPQIKKNNSDSKQMIKSPSIKRINTF